MAYRKAFGTTEDLLSRYEHFATVSDPPFLYALQDRHGELRCLSPRPLPLSHGMWLETDWDMEAVIRLEEAA